MLPVLAALVLGACGSESAAVPNDSTQQPSPTVDELSTLIAMQQDATEVPTATPWPTHTPTPTPEPTLTPTITRTPTSVPPTPFPVYPTNTPRATQAVVLTDTPPTLVAAANPVSAEDHYWFARPFPRDPGNQVKDYISRNYPYGSTGNGQFQVHHGVDIQNTLGTDILAVADGWVVYAGSDEREMFGPQTDYYGNLVMIEHDYPAPNGQLLYTLYGHMSEVDVESGQRVKQGEKIGEVGASGVALGAHLHLEVRIGDPHDYSHTYNPDLWLHPWPTFGTLAGRITDRDGRLAYDATITLRSDGGPDRSTYSYADDTVNPDPVWGENFVRGDLPQGDYRVFVRMQGVLRYQGRVTIQAGKTAWLDIVLN